MPRHVPLSDDARFPLIPEDGRGLLRALRQHPHAPRWNLACGDRLDAPTRDRLAGWAAALARGPAAWTPGEVPGWVEDLRARLVQTVPFYRARGGASLCDVPSFRRPELASAPWAFVPDDQELDDLLVYPTSGTTGPAFEVYSHPFAASAYLAFLQVALARAGVELRGGPDQTALVAVHHQRGTYTYPSLMSWLDGAGFAKINLHPDEWRDPGDAVAFLDALRPQVYTGDPWAFEQLARLPLTHRPAALVSSATALLPGQRARLVAHFGCPVLDLYSLTEARLIAADLGPDLGGGHEILAHDLFVEILDPLRDQPVAPGARGEIVVSGGCNPLLPLLRYRTGDLGRLHNEGGRMVIRGLEGRAPVCLLDAAGAVVNTIDVSRALAPFALPAFQLHQAADGALTLRVRGDEPAARLQAALAPLFGGLPLEITAFEAHLDPGAKVVPYLSEVTPPASARAVFQA